MLRIIFLTTLMSAFLLTSTQAAPPWVHLSDITQVIRNAPFMVKSRDMLREFKTQRTTPCSVSATPPCPKTIWEKKIQELAGKSRRDQIEGVNSFFNAFRYISDGNKDVYATPFELISRNGGDCEDTAFAKLLMLVELGFNSETSYVAIAKAYNDIWHAYALVSFEGSMSKLDIFPPITAARPIFLIDATAHFLTPIYPGQM